MVPTQLLADRIVRLSHMLERGLYERQQVIRLCLLAALCGESVFLLGPPGIAKSLIARRLKFAFRDARSFEYLMTRFSTPEELFGPLSIQALKDEGRYQRLTEGYLPSAEIVFLDEIWKAGPAILNTLLTAINERRFRNGADEQILPLRLLITASNELPDKQSGLDALFDRMLVRLWLANLHEKRNFHGMLLQTADYALTPADETLRISNEEYQQWQLGISKVRLPDEVFELIYQLRAQLTQHNEAPYISDRRWKKAVHLLQAGAFFSGRAEIAAIDLVLLKECLWYSPESKQFIEQQIKQLLTRQGWQQQQLLTQLQQLNSQRLAAQQQHDLHNALQLEKPSRRFSRQPRYQLPANLPEAQLDLILQSPLTLHEINVHRVVLQREDLCQWLKKGGAIRGQLNGIGFGQGLDLQVDDQGFLLLCDLSLTGSRLHLNNPNQPTSPHSEQSDRALTELKQRIIAQRLKFHQQQSSLFIDNEWLVLIEESLQEIADKIDRVTP